MIEDNQEFFSFTFFYFNSMEFNILRTVLIWTLFTNKSPNDFTSWQAYYYITSLFYIAYTFLYYVVYKHLYYVAYKRL